MCGIAGILRLDGRSAGHPIVAAMAEAQRHRGPDDGGTWSDGPVALGNRRLSIIGLDATGRQPLANEDGSVVVTFNGEIYNYVAVRDRLRARGHAFRTSTDTEVLVHAYEEWGPERFLDSLNGIFGLALWDTPRQRLVLARDRLGVKRVYVEVTDEQVTFASEINALARARSHLPELDPVSLDAYFALGYVPEPRTIWRGVRCLAPGTMQVWEHGAARVYPYWHLRPGMRPAPETFDESVEAVRDGLRRAVRRQLVSDVPVGLFLSGGVDSAGVAGLMAEVSSQPLKAFTIGFSSPGFDEVPAAQRVAQHLGAEHHTAVLEPDAWQTIPRLALQYGQPFADSSAIAVAMVSELAARHVKVVLCGDGGDELFGGYPTYTASQLVGAYQALPEPGRVALRALAARLPVSHGKVTLAEKARRFLASAHRPAPAAHLYWRQYFTPEERARLLGRTEVPEQPVPLEGLLAPFLTATADFPGLDRYLALDLANYLPSDMLFKVDVASMMHSLEARLPLLDHELVELAFSLPPGVKRRAGHGKRVLRAALAGLVPGSVLNSPKQGFNVPIAAWLAGPLLPRISEILRPGGAKALDRLDSAFVARLLDEHEQRRADHSYRLWALLVFCLWHEAPGSSHVDGGTAVAGNMPTDRGASGGPGQISPATG